MEVNFRKCVVWLQKHSLLEASSSLNSTLADDELLPSPEVYIDSLEGDLPLSGRTLGCITPVSFNNNDDRHEDAYHSRLFADGRKTSQVVPRKRKTAENATKKSKAKRKDEEPSSASSASTSKPTALLTPKVEVISLDSSDEDDGNQLLSDPLMSDQSACSDNVSDDSPVLKQLESMLLGFHNLPKNLMWHFVHVTASQLEPHEQVRLARSLLDKNVQEPSPCAEGVLDDVEQSFSEDFTCKDNPAAFTIGTDRPSAAINLL